MSSSLRRDAAIFRQRKYRGQSRRLPLKRFREAADIRLDDNRVTVEFRDFFGGLVDRRQMIVFHVGTTDES